MKKWMADSGILGALLLAVFVLGVLSINILDRSKFILGEQTSGSQVSETGGEQDSKQLQEPTQSQLPPQSSTNLSQPTIAPPQETTLPPSQPTPLSSSPAPTEAPVRDFIPVVPSEPLPVQSEDGTKTVDIGSPSVDVVLVNRDTTVTAVALPHQDGAPSLSPLVPLEQVIGVPVPTRVPLQSPQSTAKEPFFTTGKLQETTIGRFLSSLPFFGKKNMLDTVVSTNMTISSDSVALEAKAVDIVTQWLAFNQITVTPLKTGGFLVRRNNTAVYTVYPVAINLAQIQLAVKTPSTYEDIVYLPDQAVTNLKDRGILTGVINPEGISQAAQYVITAPSEIITLKDYPDDLKYEFDGYSQQYLFAAIPFKIISTYCISAQTLNPCPMKQSTFYKIADFLSV